MHIPDQSTIEGFFYKLSLIAAGIVLFISLFNGFGIISIMWRSALAFLSIYLLGRGCLIIWQSITPRPFKERDISASYYEALVEDEGVQEIKTIQPDNTPQLENMPGQIRTDIKHHLQEDDKTKAEIIRRMGLEEDQQ